MRASLLNRTITIERRTDSGSVDAYGNQTDTVTTEDVLGELQQVQRSETGETISETRWLLVLPAGTDLGTDDAVVVDGKRFEVAGGVWHARNPRTQAESHVEATVRRAAGGEDAA